MCKVCGNDRCIKRYLLHPKELEKILDIKNKEMKENNQRAFVLLDSPGSGEIFVRFKELHVIDS